MFKEEIERMKELEGFRYFEVIGIQKSPKQHVCRFCLKVLRKRKMKLVGYLNYQIKQVFACKHCYKEFIRRCRHVNDPKPGQITLKGQIQKMPMFDIPDSDEQRIVRPFSEIAAEKKIPLSIYSYSDEYDKLRKST